MITIPKGTILPEGTIIQVRSSDSIRPSAWGMHLQLTEEVIWKTNAHCWDAEVITNKDKWSHSHIDHCLKIDEDKIISIPHISNKEASHLLTRMED